MPNDSSYIATGWSGCSMSCFTVPNPEGAMLAKPVRSIIRFPSATPSPSGLGDSTQATASVDIVQFCVAAPPLTICQFGNALDPPQSTLQLHLASTGSFWPLTNGPMGSSKLGLRIRLGPPPE